MVIYFGYPVFKGPPTKKFDESPPREQFIHYPHRKFNQAFISKLIRGLLSHQPPLLVRRA